MTGRGQARGNGTRAGRQACRGKIELGAGRWELLVVGKQNPDLPAGQVSSRAHPAISTFTQALIRAGRSGYVQSRLSPWGVARGNGGGGCICRSYVLRAGNSWADAVCKARSAVRWVANNPGNRSGGKIWHLRGRRAYSRGCMCGGRGRV